MFIIILSIQIIASIHYDPYNYDKHSYATT